MKVDVILPAYKFDTYRLKSLKLHQQRDDVGLIVVKQNVSIWPEFNKGWLLNIGVNQSKADYVAIVDVDVVPMQANYYQNVIAFMHERKLRWCFGWDRLVYDGKDGGNPERDDWPSPGIQEGGIVLFERSLWQEMGGANEHVRELRGCDNELALCAMYVSGTRTACSGTLHHYWHPRSPMKKTRWKKNNIGILAYTLKHTKQVIKLKKKQQNGSSKGPYCRKKSFYEWRTGK